MDKCLSENFFSWKNIIIDIRRINLVLDFPVIIFMVYIIIY